MMGVSNCQSDSLYSLLFQTKNQEIPLHIETGYWVVSNFSLQKSMPQGIFKRVSLEKGHHVSTKSHTRHWKAFE